MSTTHKKKVYQNFIIPATLNQDIITLSTSKLELNKLYYIIATILNLNYNTERNLNLYKEISSSYFTKMLGEGYFNFLNKLRDSSILESTQSYTIGTKSKSHRISPNYFNANDDNISVKYSYIAKTPTTSQFLKDEKELATFKNNFHNINIPYKKLYAAIDQRVSNISIDDYENVPYYSNATYAIAFTNPEEYTYLVTNTRVKEWKQPLTKTEALQIAFINKLSLIKTETVLITDPIDFIDKQKAAVKQAWTSSVDNLTTETLYAKRNSTNSRLDTNFTNLPSELYKIILDHNDYLDLDLINSQPTLLAHLLKKESNTNEIEGIKEFIEVTEEGNFYEIFGSTTSSRKKVKQMIFKILFGNNPMPERIPPKNKTLLRFYNKFPAVYMYIYNYKKNGKNSIAIKLQRLEAQLFIDGIYKDLLGQGINCFTKHDSVAFPKQDLEIVKETIKSNFNKINFKGQVKVS